MSVCVCSVIALLYLGHVSVLLFFPGHSVRGPACCLLWSHSMLCLINGPNNNFRSVFLVVYFLFFFYPCDKGNSMFLPKCLNIVTALCASIKFEKTPHCFPLSQNSKWATTCCQHSCQCTLAYLQYILQVLLIHIAGAKRHSSNKCHAFDAMVDSMLTCLTLWRP